MQEREKQNEGITGEANKGKEKKLDHVGAQNRRRAADRSNGR